MSDRTRSGRPNELPLETTEWTEKDEETGEDVQVTCLRRGVLKRETRCFASAYAGFTALADQKTTRRSLEDYCAFIRDQLSKAGLPSDATPSWFKGPSGEWEVYNPTVHKAQFRSGQAAWQLWTKRLEEMTEPLSRERLAGELLFDLTQLLRRPGVDEHLWHIVKVVLNYSTFRIAVATNKMATAGMRASKGRANGPRSRRDRAAAKRDIIWHAAQSYWCKRPIYRNDGSNTGLAIASAVNKQKAES
jgi:hypothetical protein